MLKKLISLGAATIAALVAGCGDGPSTVPGFRAPATWSTFFAATAKGPLLLQVHGQPFGGSEAELRRKVAAVMQAAIPARPFSMTLDPAEAPQPKVRVVLALGAPANFDAAGLCSGSVPVAGAPVGSGRLEVLAGLCDGGALLSSVRGWVARLDGPDDSRFVQLLGQVMRDLTGEPQ